MVWRELTLGWLPLLKLKTMANQITKEEALYILEQYQLWRTGKIDWFPVSPSKLTLAINMSVDALKEKLQNEKDQVQQ